MCHGDDTYKTCIVILLSERHLNLRFAVTRKSNKNSKYLSCVKRIRAKGQGRQDHDRNLVVGFQPLDVFGEGVASFASVDAGLNHWDVIGDDVVHA